MKKSFVYKSVAFFFFLLLLLSAGFLLIQMGKTLPNTYVGASELGGLSKQDLETSINKIANDFERKSVTVNLRDLDGKEINKIDVSYRDLGLLIDKRATVEKAYGRGGAEASALRAVETVKSFFVKERVEPAYALNEDIILNFLGVLSSNFAYEPKNATIEYLKGEYQIVPSSDGQVLNNSEFVEKLKANVLELSNNNIEVSLINKKPLMDEGDSLGALDKVKALDLQNISLNFERDYWTISGDNLIEMLEFYPRGLRGGAFANVEIGERLVSLNDFEYKNREKRNMEIGLNREYLNEFVEKMAQSIDRETVDATLVFDGEKVSNFSPAIDGKKLDVELTRKLVLAKVSVDSSVDEKTILINLPVKVTKAKIADEGIQSLGIKELIGSGVSYFRGSIANRIFNLSLGADRISGTVVKPGDTFSFNKSVGDISAASGYKQAYVISAGRTVLDDGGGICQVSTTAFRAALNAGLPIVERTAHAYRVSYYEQGGFGPGIDATIWSPSVDFVFRNDTDHHILVQTVVDRTNSKLQVDIYGTLDGRKVEMTAPVVSNIKPALPDKFEDDPTLASGTVKQVDFAATGATTVFGRKVFKNGEVLIDEKFTSNFRPWQAVYLVGTGGLN